jgi:hypothetical protein
MNFKQYENGSCDIEFSWKERLIILKKGKVHLSDEALKHFGNNLVLMVAQWQDKFNEELKTKLTFKNTEIKGE